MTQSNTTMAGINEIQEPFDDAMKKVGGKVNTFTDRPLVTLRSSPGIMTRAKTERASEAPFSRAKAMEKG